MSKIKCISGDSSVLLLCPHGGGPTDVRTALMSEIIAEKTNSCAVINIGWIRNWVGNEEGTNNPANNLQKSNLAQGFANLNDLSDCNKTPLALDFLRPIELYRNKIVTKHGRANIFIIHGMDDIVRDYNGVDAVIGFGNGNPSRNTCLPYFKDRFLGFLQLEKFTPANGKIGGRLSGWDHNNLNQLYVYDQFVNSLQVEIGLTLRDSDQKATLTAERIADVINRTIGNEPTPTLKNVQER